MKKILLILAAAIAVAACAGKVPDQVIDTSEMGKDIIGYKGPVPVQVTIKDGKVESVVALENQETPKFFDRAAPILHSWDGLKVSKARDLQVDAVSGATYTSNAIIANVHLALDSLQP